MEKFMEIRDSYTANKYQYKPAKLTDEELLPIFPEAKEIIPEKISEYQEERTNLINRMRTFRDKVKKVTVAKKKDEFFVWFWGYAYLKHLFAPGVVLIDKHLFRLKRQLRMLNGNNQTNNAELDFANQKERAKQRSLVDIALPYLVRARYGGNRITALCPFHEEKTPSFTVYADQNTFHCYGCQAHGDVINFKMKIDNLSFKEAVKELAL